MFSPFVALRRKGHSPNCRGVYYTYIHSAALTFDLSFTQLDKATIYSRTTESHLLFTLPVLSCYLLKVLLLIGTYLNITHHAALDGPQHIFSSPLANVSRKASPFSLLETTWGVPVLLALVLRRHGQVEDCVAASLLALQRSSTRLRSVGCRSSKSSLSIQERTGRYRKGSLKAAFLGICSANKAYRKRTKKLTTFVAKPLEATQKVSRNKLKREMQHWYACLFKLVSKVSLFYFPLWI